MEAAGTPHGGLPAVGGPDERGRHPGIVPRQAAGVFPRSGGKARLTGGSTAFPRWCGYSTAVRMWPRSERTTSSTGRWAVPQTAVSSSAT